MDWVPFSAAGQPCTSTSGGKVIQIGQGYWKFIATGTCKEAAKVSLVMEITTPTSREVLGEFDISWVSYITGGYPIRFAT